MHLSNFTSIEKEYPQLAHIGKLAERNTYIDPSTTLSKLRLLLELLSKLITQYEYIDDSDRQDQLSRLQKLETEGVVPQDILDLFHKVRVSGNKATHAGEGTTEQARFMLRQTVKVVKWFYAVYENQALDFDFVMPVEQLDDRSEIEALERELASAHEEVRNFKEKLATIGNVSKDQKTERILRANRLVEKIEETEVETRERIDQQLREAGWEVNSEELNHWKKGTLPEAGRKIAIAEWVFPNKKRADYALFIGEALFAVIEAKKWGQDISQDLRQAKLYSEYATEQRNYLLGNWKPYAVPFVFATNGRPYLEQLKTKSGIWFLDIRNERNRSRALRGWFTPAGLKELYEMDRSEADKKLKDADLDYLQNSNSLGLRYYQIEAIKAVEDKIATNHEDRRALLTMATGTGKTRTTLGLCYRLIKANRFKRILFMVDRRLLAEQALDTFTDTKVEDVNTFAETYKVSTLREMIPELDTRLHFATVQSMVKRLFYSDNPLDRLPIDTYDCIIVDEAHRGYLQDREMDEDELSFKNQHDYVSKYRMVLDYFDAYAVGLTATPALHTKEIFGSAVYTYSYRKAVIDGYLVDHEPPYIIHTKLNEEGIVWEKGTKPKVFDLEDNALIELEELEDELKIDIAGFNNRVITENFNRTVIQQLVKELDPLGEEKTLVFAAKDDHADLVVQLFKEEFEKIGVDVPDNAIAKITGKSYNPRELVTRYKNEEFPNIAVTVDLLTTGIDVPKICNLVFLRRIKSRILYEQMLGRATRLCDDIGKEVFRIYDAVKVYETLEDFTSMKPVSPNPSASFTQLVKEIPAITSTSGSKKQLEQIVAKLQRKRKFIEGSNKDKFCYLSGGKDVQDFIDTLLNQELTKSLDLMIDKPGLWLYLDQLKAAPHTPLWSDHKDEYRKTERGYGRGEKPVDYLDGFKRFIEENRTKIDALHIICTRPKELDRASLKELLLELDAQGYTTLSLNAAWKDVKNEDAAADIISFIRTLALGSSLVSHEERIKRAVDKVRALRDWNKVQQRWIERFEKQLLKEYVIQPSDLDTDPFDEAGGFERLDKIFEHQLNDVIEVINENLYDETA